MISVIIPTFNREISTNRAIKSILSQNIQADIIVIDDASDKVFSLDNDNQNHPNIHVIRKNTNEGAAGARNLGVEISTQPLISFLDSDDYLMENTLKSRVEYAVKKGILTDEGKSQIIGCGWQEASVAGEVNKTRYPKASSTPDDFFSGCWFCPGSAIIMNRSLLVDAGIKFDPNLKRLEDLDLFMRLGMNGANYQAHTLVGASITTSDSRYPDVVIDACKTITAKYLSNESTLNERLQARLKSYLFYELSRAYISKHEYHRALDYLVKSFIQKPRLSLYPGPGWASTSNQV